VQGDKEREAGCEISPYMDRNDTDQAKMSINFLDFVVLPLYKALAAQFQEMKPCMENLTLNRDYWLSKQKPIA
jgi:cAMP-specific phosphodiesterase 4